MAGFIRRYLTYPGLTEILKIEGVVIIDREPLAAITGVGSGTTTIVGEFEDGDFASPTEVTSGADLQNEFGGFGYEYDGTLSNNPCARSRKADSALRPEYWNGNGFLSVVNKRFSRLIISRVDTSVGSVQFRRQAYLTGAAGFTFALTSGQVLSFDVGGGALPATFTGAVATRIGATATYPSTFTGGETLSLVIDEGTDQQIGPVTVVFQAGDQSQAQVISRINQFLGYTAAIANSATVLRIDGRVAGTSGGVRVIAVSSSLVTTATGQSVGTTAGTGNVANVAQVTAAEVNTLVAAASTNTVRVVRDQNGALRAYGADTTAGADLTVASGTTAVNLGFAVGATSTNSVGIAGVLPAGTRVRNAGGSEWVTMQSVDIAADNVGPYDVKVRPADDDGTASGAGAGTVTTVPFSPAVGAFGVTNLQPLTAALTENQLDVKYLEAIDATLNTKSIARETNIIASARQSNAIRTRLRQNALDASTNGLLGRIAVIRPPLGTSRAIALSTSAQPGVGAYRNQRVVYAFPGISTYVPQIAARGLGGGAGFTADGFVDLGFDTWVASVMSQLPPEENPGQLTEFLNSIDGIERGNPDVQNMQMGDYEQFRAKGIAAPRMDSGTCVIQSGVTSVDPLVNPNLRNIARRRMADYIQDTLALRLKSYSKKLNRRSLRAQQLGEIDSFMTELYPQNNDDLQRIAGYTIDGKSGNTQFALDAGVFRIILCVKTLASQDDIVLDTTIGETVVIEEAA